MPSELSLARPHLHLGRPHALTAPLDRTCTEVRCTAGPISVVVSAAPSAQALAAWDTLVANTPGTDVSQLAAWMRVRGAVGYAVLHIFVFHGERLVAGAQVLHRRVPALGRMGYVPFGPVIASVTPAREDICRVLGDAFEALARFRLRALLVQPPDDADDVSCDLLRRGFRRSDAIAGAGTLRLDLDRSEQELRRKLGKRLRSWTNRWTHTGVTVRLGDGTDIGVLNDLMCHTARHHGFSPLSATYVQSIYRELAPSGHVVLFVGEVDGRAVAADLLTGCGGVIKGRLTGFDRSGATSRLSVPGAVRWEAIRWAKAHGYRWFDFGGISNVTLHGLLAGEIRDDPTWPSTDRAKVSFGGGPYRYPAAVELIRPAAMRGGYDLLRQSDAGRRLVARLSQLLVRSTTHRLPT